MYVDVNVHEILFYRERDTDIDIMCLHGARFPRALLQILPGTFMSFMKRVALVAQGSMAMGFAWVLSRE